MIVNGQVEGASILTDEDRSCGDRECRRIWSRQNCGDRMRPIKPFAESSAEAARQSYSTYAPLPRGISPLVHKLPRLALCLFSTEAQEIHHILVCNPAATLEETDVVAGILFLPERASLRRAHAETTLEACIILGLDEFDPLGLAIVLRPIIHSKRHRRIALEAPATDRLRCRAEYAHRKLKP